MAVTVPPRVTETPVEAWAHCSNPRCEGNGQKRVQGVRVVSEWTIASRGGDSSSIFAQIVENSNERLRFLNDGTEGRENEEPCPVCEGPREITLQERPVIPMITGFPQDGLLGGGQFKPGVVNTEADQRAAEERAAQNVRIAELESLVAGMAEKKAG